MRILLPLVAVLLCTRSAALPAQQPAKNPFDPEPVAGLLELVLDADADTARKCLAVLTEKTQTGELSADQVASLKKRLLPALEKILRGKGDDPLHFPAALLAASWRLDAAVPEVRQVFTSGKQPDERRLQALGALIAAGDQKLLADVAGLLADREKNSAALRASMLAALGKLDDPQVAPTVIAAYPRLEETLQPKAIVLLTQRTAWSKALLRAIGDKKIPTAALGVNQVRQLLASRDEELKQLVTAKWGSIRSGRDPKRQQVIVQMRTLLRETEGDPVRGQAIFAKVCGQCHKIYGQGNSVGPDLTSNGRSSLEQLLSNVFDPSLVIGASYQARIVNTAEGRVLSGLLVEDSPQRIVLNTQGGKLETIPRDDVDELTVSKLSLMPEGLEKQLKPQEIADLFSFLLTTEPPVGSNGKK